MSTLLKKKDHSWLKPKKGIDPLGLHKPFRSKPLIVAVKGVTFTYGLELMLSSDIALCGRKTSFAMLEALRGLLILKKKIFTLKYKTSIKKKGHKS